MSGIPIHKDLWGSWNVFAMDDGWWRFEYYFTDGSGIFCSMAYPTRLIAEEECKKFMLKERRRA